MFSINILQIIVICSIFMLNIYAEDTNNETVSVINEVEELQMIKNKFSNQLKDYVDARIQEIDRLLGKSSSKWDFIKDINTIQTWWSIDLNRRQDLYYSKLGNLLNETNVVTAFENMRQEFTENLGAAENFWHKEIDIKLDALRKNPQIFKSLIKEPIFTTEHPPLKLSSPEHQTMYEQQMYNLTNIATILKEILRSTIEQLEPKLPEKEHINYISQKTKFNMIAEKFRLNMNRIIDSTRIFATERVSGDWRIQGKNGPTMKEFNDYYNGLSNYGTNLVKNLNNTIAVELNSFLEQ